MKKIILIAFLSFSTSCTYNVVLNPTVGQTSDVIDEKQSASAEVSPHVSLIPK